MSIPKLNRRLVLEGLERSPDGAGGFVETWQELGVHWAEIRPGTGREIGGQAMTLTRVPCRITVRAAPVGAPSRPLPDHRFREGDRIFEVLAVTERDPGAHYLTCFAEEELGA